MRILQRRNKKLLTILALELVVLGMLGLVLDSASTPALSGIGPYTVNGVVTDSEGRLVQGADVAVTIVQTSTTLTCTTDSDGFYQVEFSDFEWNDGNDIQVIATYGGQAMASGTCDGLTGFSQINVQFAYEIPEFGGVVGFSVVGVAVASLAIVMAWKRPR